MKMRLLGLSVLVLGILVIASVTLAAGISSAPHDPERANLASRSYPGWVQVNDPGFGDPNNAVSSMAVFNSKIYAGAVNDNGARLWVSPDGLAWTPVTVTGWLTTTTEVAYLKVYGTYLYAGTTNMVSGAEIWRTNGGAWERVVAGGFSDATNISVGALAGFGSYLYAFVGNYVASPEAVSLKLWRSATGASGTWQPVSLGDMSGVWPTVAVDVYGSNLYLGLSRVDKAELWRSSNGTAWSPVFTGTQTVSNTHVLSLAEFGGNLYAGLRNTTGGGQIWRSVSGSSGMWQRVVSTGIGNPQNRGAYGLIGFNGKLYAVFSNVNTGVQVWRTSNGIAWEWVAGDGWGSGAVHFADYFDKAAAIFNGRLYIGTFDGPAGGEIWKKTITANFTASPTLGAPPLTVHFANRSSGDYASSAWTFGDGASSTETSPSHSYSAIGTYTVTLSIGDGVETNAITRTQYIKTRYLVFAPVILGER